MGKILCLETATTNCSVAISVDGEIAAIRESNDQGYSHAEKLHLFIDEVMGEANLDFSQLDAVAVSKGPGSYTGLRIGVSAAKGICYASDIPLISVPTLDALAMQVSVPQGGHIIPLLDARRMEVYSKVLDWQYSEVKETAAEIVDEQSFGEYINSTETVFLGSGAEKVKGLFPDSEARFELDRFPSTREMAKLAEDKLSSSQFEDVAYFEPYYLKDFIAG